MDREVVRLKIEKEALKKETDAISKERLKRLEKELVELEEQAAALTSKWKAERGKLSDAQKLKSELEQATNWPMPNGTVNTDKAANWPSCRFRS